MPQPWAVAAFVGAAAATSGGAMAQPSGTLTLDGVPRPVRGATFSMFVRPEVWDPEARTNRYDLATARVGYGIAVDVDDRSGEDGAPAPEVSYVPVARANGGSHPSLEALAGLDVREQGDDDCDEWDAWFGNDAPALCGNRVTFGGWEGNALRVRWEAHYDAGGRRRPFLFEGLVAFTGIHVEVRRAEEADACLARAWGGQPVEALQRHVLGWSDAGPTFGPDRRFGYSVVYARPGAPLHERWRPLAPTQEAATAAHEAQRARFAAARATGTAPAPPPGSLPPSGPPRRIAESAQRFSLEVPGDWAVVPAEEDPVMARLGGLSLRRGAGPGEETLKAVAVEMRIADDVSEYADTSAGAYRSIWAVEKREDVTLAGARAVRLVVLQTIGAASTRLLKYFVALPERQAVVLTLAAPPDAFAARLEEFETIARSLQIAR